MIGYNEKKEAMNALELLLKSRRFIPLFNMDDAQIAACCGLKNVSETDMADLRVRWYAGLAFAIRDMSRSGLYAQCFSSADKAVRQPYDLLARLDPQPVEEKAYLKAEDAYRQMQAAEQENAPAPEPTPEQMEELDLEPTIDVKGFRWLRDIYLADLPEEEKKRARILYDRLLRIQPMRTLLSRLMTLAKVLRNTKTPGPDVTNTMDIRLSREAETSLNELLSNGSIRTQIPSWQERKKKALLDVRGHDFTILDRLMDNWDRRLRHEEQFALPADLLFTVGHVPTLLTAAIVHKVAPAEQIPAPSAPDGDKKADSAASARRQYCSIPGGHSLLGIYDEREGSTPDKFFNGVVRKQTDGKVLRLMRVRGYAGLKLVQLTDDAERKLNSAVFEEASIGKKLVPEADNFCALDKGGRQLARMMSLELLKERRETDGEECLLDFMKGEEQTDAQRVMAIRRMQEDVAAYFAKNKIRSKSTSLLTPVGNKKNLHVRAVERLLACMTDGLRIMSCPDSKMPDEVSRYLKKLLEDAQERNAFAEQVKALQSRSKHLNMCFSSDGANRFLRVWSHPEAEFQPVRQWLAAADQAESSDKLQHPAFAAKQLRDCCVGGLKRFIYLGNQIQNLKAPFPLGVNNTAVADTCFRLVCLWVKLRCSPASSDRIVLVCNENNPEESCFRVGNEQFSFVDLIATDDTEAEENRMSPESLWENLASLRNQTFGLEKDCSKAEVVPPYSEFVVH